MLNREKFAATAAEKVKTVQYKDLDCQAFVEYCAKKAGYTFNALGSNDMYRHYTKAKGKTATFKPTVGDIVFKWREESSKLPSKYHGDGIGDMYHVGVITAAANGKYTVCHSSSPTVNGVIDNYNSLSALAKVWAYAATLKNTAEPLPIVEDEPEEEDTPAFDVVEGGYYDLLNEYFDTIEGALDELKELVFNS